MIEFLKNQGFSKLAFGFAAVAFAILGKWMFFHWAIAIFVYTNLTALLNVTGISKWWKEFWAKTNG